MENQKPDKSRASIKVCLGGKCRAKGADDVYHNLKEGIPKEEALVEGIERCFNCCEDGPNIAINDNIVKGVKPFSVVDRVRDELKDHSCKADGLGSKGIEHLDDVLEDITSL